MWFIQLHRGMATYQPASRCVTQPQTTIDPMKTIYAIMIAAVMLAFAPTAVEARDHKHRSHHSHSHRHNSRHYHKHGHHHHHHAHGHYHHGHYHHRPHYHYCYPRS